MSNLEQSKNEFDVIKVGNIQSLIRIWQNRIENEKYPKSTNTGNTRYKNNNDKREIENLYDNNLDKKKIPLVKFLRMRVIFWKRKNTFQEAA